LQNKILTQILKYNVFETIFDHELKHVYGMKTVAEKKTHFCLIPNRNVSEGKVTQKFFLVFC